MSLIVTTDAYAKSITGFSSVKIVFVPPLDSQIILESLIRSDSSSGSIDIPVSGPGHERLIVKCFSRTQGLQQ